MDTANPVVKKRVVMTAGPSTKRAIVSRKPLPSTSNLVQSKVDTIGTLTKLTPLAQPVSEVKPIKPVTVKAVKMGAGCNACAARKMARQAQANAK